MNPIIMPMIPAGATPINRHVGVINEDGQWTYLLGFYPVYRHRTRDLRSFRLTIAQLADSGACRPVELTNAFGISKSQMMRALRQYREWGLGAFFEKAASSGEVREGFIHGHSIALQALGNAGNALLKRYPSRWASHLPALAKINWSRSNSRLWEGRALIGGKVSKVTTNVVLTTNVVKKALGLALDSLRFKIRCF